MNAPFGSDFRDCADIWTSSEHKLVEDDPFRLSVKTA